MQRTMSSEELSVYTNQIKNPSETFKLFLHHYVTGSIWIRSRGEEDVSVWEKLKDNELEVAKQIIIDELKIVLDFSYIRAVGFFRDKRAIPLLKNIIDTYPKKWIAEKLFAAKVLYDWVGYDDYISMLEAVCQNRADDMMYSYLKVSIDQFIEGLNEEDKARIMDAMSHPICHSAWQHA